MAVAKEGDGRGARHRKDLDCSPYLQDRLLATSLPGKSEMDLAWSPGTCPAAPVPTEGRPLPAVSAGVSTSVS